MKRILSLILMICGVSATYAQDHLVTHRFIRDKVTAGYFQQKAGTTIPLDDKCINATEAKAWLHLVENMLPAEPNRMPWWSELVPAQKVLSCSGTYSDPACQADNESYGACGSWLYTSFDVHFESFTRQRLGGTTNSLWNPSAALAAEYCSTPPVTQSSSAMATQGMSSGNADTAFSTASFSGSPDTGDAVAVTGSMMVTESIWSGALNRCGVWACNDVGTEVWMSVSGSFTAPTAKTYYVGVGADNLFELYIDGVLTAAMNDPVTASEESFLLWHILPVTLTAGSHTIELKARNTQAGPASLGCEVYNNTPAELGSAGSVDDLELLFTSKAYRGGTICRSGPVNNFEIVVANNCLSDPLTVEYNGVQYQVYQSSELRLNYTPGAEHIYVGAGPAYYELHFYLSVDDVPQQDFWAPSDAMTQIPFDPMPTSEFLIEVNEVIENI